MLGSGIRLTQSLLGHASIRTTERYSHVVNDPVRAAADKAAGEIAAMLHAEPGIVPASTLQLRRA